MTSSVNNAATVPPIPSSTLTEEESNFLRFLNLILKIAPEAVRAYFDAVHPPAALQNDLALNQHTLSQIRGNVIKNNQWNNLYPGTGSATSSDFDITLLICLLRNMTPKVQPPPTGFDKLPNNSDVSVGADMARIKHYRNEAAHNKSGKMTYQDFHHHWNILENAVGRIGGPTFINKIKCARVAIMDSSLNEILMPILQHEKILEELEKDTSANKDQTETQQLKLQEQELDISKHQEDIGYCQKKIMTLLQEVVRNQRAINKHEEEVARQSQTIHRQDKTLQRIDGTVEQIDKATMENSDEICRIKQKQDDTKDFYQIEVQRWESKNRRFVKTDAVNFILQTLHDKNCVTVIGAPSVGKSSAMWHAVLHLRDTKGYSIVPCHSASDIVVNYRKNKNQVFVIEDVCGRYTALHNDIEEWGKHEKTLAAILELGCTKIIASCRLQVFRESQFQRLSIFTRYSCDLSSQTYSLSMNCKFKIAIQYFPSGLVNLENHLAELSFPAFLNAINNNYKMEIFNPYNFYKAELDELKRQHDKTKFCALFLCVVFNGSISESMFTDIEYHADNVRLNDIFEECEIERGCPKGRIRDHLDSLVNTYLKKEETKCYTVTEIYNYMEDDYDDRYCDGYYDNRDDDDYYDNRDDDDYCDNSDADDCYDNTDDDDYYDNTDDDDYCDNTDDDDCYDNTDDDDCYDNTDDDDYYDNTDDDDCYDNTDDDDYYDNTDDDDYHDNTDDDDYYDNRDDDDYHDNTDDDDYHDNTDDDDCYDNTDDDDCYDNTDDDDYYDNRDDDDYHDNTDDDDYYDNRDDYDYHDNTDDDDYYDNTDDDDYYDNRDDVDYYYDNRDDDDYYDNRDDDDYYDNRDYDDYYDNRDDDDYYDNRDDEDDFNDSRMCIYTLSETKTAYVVLNEKLFSFLCFYFGQTLQRGLIRYADSKVLRDRTQLKSLQANIADFDIAIEEHNEDEYFKRLEQELSIGNSYDVLHNKQVCRQAYKCRLLDHIRKRSSNSKMVDVVLKAMSD